MAATKAVVRLSSSVPSSSSSLSLSFLTAVVMVMVVAVGTGVGVVRGERILGEYNDDFDFDGLPGVHHEFKVEINARTQDCFFQRVAKAASVYVSIAVLRGGDRIVNLWIRNTYGKIVGAEHGKTDAVIEFLSASEDTYAICVDNFDSGFSGKLVYVYIMVFVMDDWSAYAKEMDEISLFADNATMILGNVEQSVQTMRTAQSQLRQHAMRDTYLAWSNQSYVSTWSLLQCLVIVVTSVLQVIFVRRLFRTTYVVGSSSKPRA